MHNYYFFCKSAYKGLQPWSLDHGAMPSSCILFIQLYVYTKILTFSCWTRGSVSGLFIASLRTTNPSAAVGDSSFIHRTLPAQPLVLRRYRQQWQGEEPLHAVMGVTWWACKDGLLFASKGFCIYIQVYENANLLEADQMHVWKRSTGDQMHLSMNFEWSQKWLNKSPKLIDTGSNR